MPIQPSTHSQRNAGRGGDQEYHAERLEENDDTSKKRRCLRGGKNAEEGEREFEVMEQTLDPHSVPHAALELVLSCAETDPQVMLHAFTAHTHGLLSADGKRH